MSIKRKVMKKSSSKKDGRAVAEEFVDRWKTKKFVLGAMVTGSRVTDYASKHSEITAGKRWVGST